MLEIRYTDQRTQQPTRVLRTEAQVDVWMDRQRAAEARGELPQGFCDSVVIVERPDEDVGGGNRRTGY